eukprot:1349129-Rhodomonas_salina.2
MLWLRVSGACIACCCYVPPVAGTCVCFAIVSVLLGPDAACLVPGAVDGPDIDDRRATAREHQRQNLQVCSWFHSFLGALVVVVCKGLHACLFHVVNCGSRQGVSCHPWTESTRALRFHVLQTPSACLASTATVSRRMAQIKSLAAVLCTCKASRAALAKALTDSS